MTTAARQALSPVETLADEDIPSDVLVNVFVELDNADAAPRRMKGETGRVGDLVTAQVSLKDVSTLADEPHVAYVSLGDALTPPRPIVNADDVEEPLRSERKIRRLESRHNYGEGVLIGIVDVQGFAFDHPDFLDNEGHTRFYRIWDQGGDIRESPEGYNYGSEFTQEQLNAALDAGRESRVAPQAIEPQSQMVPGSHGTHVASIAAGNLGVCRKALLAGVLLTLSSEDLDRRRSLYDSTRIAHAVSYLVKLAEDLAMPVSINISLGTNGHAHDASSAVSRWIDATLALPGRSVAVAAGNAGQEAPEDDDDIGFVMGRIHTSGQIPARGLDDDIEWIVVGNTISDLSENELEIWYEAQDRFSVSVKPPGMDWIGPVNPGQYIENQQLSDDTFISIYNELYHPANGSNYISIYLSPRFSQSGVVGVTAGLWRVRLHGLDVRDGHYHAWIERDDPRPLGRLGPKAAWRFPSFFSEQSNVDNSSVSSLACGHRIVSVANLDAGTNAINISSSQGPTRDGRPKPDVCASGTNIVAANGFGADDEPWIGMTGTSMASPFVAGVIGLMLSAEPRLTAAQIVGIIKRTARPLPGADYTWRDDAGFGVIDPDECIREANLVFEREDLTK